MSKEGGKIQDILIYVASLVVSATVVKHERVILYLSAM